jgi:hypothetical protein
MKNIGWLVHSEHTLGTAGHERTVADVPLIATRRLRMESIVDYAARRSYSWCNPPRCGIATIGPRVGGATGRETGESLFSDK